MNIDEKNEEILEQIKEQSEQNVEIENTNETITEENVSENVTFEDLGLDEYTLKAVAKKGFVTPSPFHVYLLATQILLQKHAQEQEKLPHLDFQSFKIFVRKVIKFKH